MKTLLPLAIIALCTVLPACALMENRPPIPPPLVPSPDAKYSNHDMDSLLAYGDELARLDAGQRLAECKHLQELGQTDQNLGWVMHLLLLQALVEDCGDRKETFSRLKLAMSLVQDERLRQFMAYQEQVLLNLDKNVELCKSANRQLKLTKHKAQKSQRQVRNRENEIKSRDNEKKTRDSEMKRLQNKLELLKSIEQNLGNPPQETNENTNIGK